MLIPALVYHLLDFAAMHFPGLLRGTAEYPENEPEPVMEEKERGRKAHGLLGTGRSGLKSSGGSCFSPGFVVEPVAATMTTPTKEVLLKKETFFFK